MVMTIGLIGLILLAVGWVPETIKVIRDRKSSIDLKFGVLYCAGSLLLVIYSIQIMDYVFVVLNTLATIMSGVSLLYSFRKARKNA